MKRLPIVILCLAVAVVILVAVSAMAWRIWSEDSREVYTDGDTIRLSQREAQPRTVLWQPPVALPAPVNSSDQEYEPRLSADGQTLYFVRGRAGGNADIFIASRKADGGWSDPQPFAAINSTDDELGPEISRDGLLFVFHSKRPGGFGGYDLWVSHKVEGQWQPPVNLGPAVNSQHNEYGAAITPAGDRLYFASNRPMGESNDAASTNAWPATLREQHSQHHYDLYLSLLVKNVPQPAALLHEVNSESNEGAPAFSPAGDFLYFCSDRAGGHGGYDLYRSRLLQSDHHPPTNLGTEVNTAFDDMDPALGMGGFELAFSSNRADSTADQYDANHSYNLYRTLSREVFLDVAQAEPLIDWASLWSMIAPSLLWLLLALLSLLALLALIKGVQSRKLSLVARCLMASLIAHMVLMLLLTFWQVTVTIAEAIERGGTQVALTSHASGDELAQQVRGGLTEVGLEIATPNTARTEPQPHPLTEVQTIDPPTQQLASASPEARPIEAAMREVHVVQNDPLTPLQPQLIDAPSIQLDATLPTEVAASATVEPESAAIMPSTLAASTPRRQVEITSTSINAPTPVPSPKPTISESPNINAVQQITAIPRESETDSPSFEPASRPITINANNVNDAPAPKVHVQLPTEQPAATQASERPATVPINAASIASARSETTLIPNPAIAPSAAQQNPPAATPSAAIPAEQQMASAASLATDSATPPASQDAPPRITANMALPASSPLASAVAIPSDNGPQSTRASETETAAAMPLESSSTANRTATPKLEHARINVAHHPAEAISPPSSNFTPSSPDARHTLPINPKSLDRANDSSLPHTAQPSPLAAAPSALASAAALPDIAIPRDLAPPAPPTPPAPPAEQFTQRAEDIRQDLVEQMGGSEATEQAVQLALKWLAAHQSEDGRWAARDFDDDCGECRGRAKFDTDIAATGLALLCFMGANHTHHKESEYKNVVERGLNWLLAHQQPDGDLRSGETMYSHGIAAIAIAEAYGMTRDPKLISHVQSAVAFICDPRNQRAGGWRYEPGQPGDTSVLGWQIMALHSAKSAGVAVPDEPFSIAARWLDTVSSETRPGLYAYQPGHRHTPSMTAEGMFVQQLLGLPPDQPRMQTSAEYISRNPPRWRNDAATYYWYYATLAMFQHQGEPWREWNALLTEQLLAHQRTTGTAAGSWDPTDNWSKIGGRIYQTALCTLCLEVYYRYLPMYGAKPQQ